MNIKISPYIQHYVGPSQSYYNAQDRFKTILSEKLGVVRENIKTETENDAVFDYSDNSKIENNAIFENITRLNKDEFSTSKTLTKNIGNISINGIIDTSDIRKKSNYSVQYINSKLSGTPLEGLGEDFKRAEDIYGVNSIVLLAMAKLESNFGRSQIAVDKNNLFGYQAYDKSPYASAKTYETKKESIYDVARHLSQNYLREGGTYFNGYSVDSVGVKYSTDKLWASKVKKISSELINL